MKWILVLILFVGDDVTDYALLVGASQEKCEKARAEAIEKGKANGVEVWGKCVELERVKQPIIPPPGRGGNS